MTLNHLTFMEFDVPNEDEQSEHQLPVNATPGGLAESSAALASRFQQMFPVLSPAEIDRVRRFGEVRRFAAGEFLFQAGEAVPGMHVILSGRIAIVPRDGLGQAVPVAAFAQLIGAPLEEMMEVVPGEVGAGLRHWRCNPSPASTREAPRRSLPADKFLDWGQLIPVPARPIILGAQRRSF